MEKKLEVCHVRQSFGENCVLRDVSLHLCAGELVSLLGVSGGGKTTLFHVIAGLQRPDAGKVLLDGADITGQTGKVSYMRQKDLLFPFRTVVDNVALPLLLRGVPRKTARETAAAQFAAFGLAGTEKLWPDQLSGGMRQRAALLRTHLFSREVALLDEPFSALDALSKRAMHRWYLGVMGQISRATLFITHDIEEALLLSHRVYLLREGEICRELFIDAPFPRDGGFLLTPAAQDYKREILAGLGEPL